MFNANSQDLNSNKVKTKDDLMTRREQQELADEERDIPSIDDLFESLLSIRKPNKNLGAK